MPRVSCLLLLWAVGLLAGESCAANLVSYCSVPETCVLQEEAAGLVNSVLSGNPGREAAQAAQETTTSAIAAGTSVAAAATIPRASEPRLPQAPEVSPPAAEPPRAELPEVDPPTAVPPVPRFPHLPNAEIGAPENPPAAGVDPSGTTPAKPTRAHPEWELAAPQARKQERSPQIPERTDLPSPPRPPARIEAHSNPAIPEASVAPSRTVASWIVIAVAGFATAAVPAVALYHRIGRSAVLLHPSRRDALAFVVSHPGCLTADIAAALDVYYNTARHHLDVLERQGLVRSRREGRRQRYFENHGRFDAQEERRLALLAVRANRTLLAAIDVLGAPSQAALARSLGLAPSTVCRRVGILVAAGLVVQKAQRVTLPGGSDVNPPHLYV